MEHIGIYARNIEESIRFYTEVLGMRLIERAPLNDKVELAFLSFPGQEDVQVELIGRDPDTADEGLVNHLAFTVEDIDAAIDRLKQAGVAVSEEWPKTILDGRKIAFFKGPSGEKLELFQR
jgi:lactoylglutathione lyase